MYMYTHICSDIDHEGTMCSTMYTVTLFIEVHVYIIYSTSNVYICTHISVQSLRHLCRRVEGREDIESFRLKMILRYAYMYIFLNER